MTAYLGTTILDATEPDRAGGARDQFARRLFELNNETGVRAVDAPTPADSLVRDFEWVCFSRAEVKVLRSFIDATFGRGLPFWLITWERDLTLSQDVGFSDPTLYVNDVSYSSLVFPIGPMRRHLAIRSPAGTAYRRVLSASVAAPNVEQVNLDAAGYGGDLFVDRTLISFLRYCRLDSDEPRIAWEGGHFARCVLPVRELPNEVPA